MLHARAHATEVTVKSSMRRSGSERTTIDYDMENSPAGWKVYDIKIDGVSLVMTYRGTRRLAACSAISGKDLGINERATLRNHAELQQITNILRWPQRFPQRCV